MHEFQLQMQTYTDQVNQILDMLLPCSEQPCDLLQQAMRYAVLNAGKRIRPIFTLEFCRISGGDVEMALPFAAAVEMIHSYSLIHDDLPCMDDDDLRRGMPTCHVQFGEAVALLAGDALLTRAFEVMAHSSYGKKYPQKALQAISELSGFAGMHGMVAGQVIDLQQRQGQSAQELTDLHLLKTGALIQAACRLGVLCGNAMDGRLLEAAAKYGEHVGLAFQLVDDVLDVVGQTEELGKPVGSDQVQGKTTFVDLFGVQQTKTMAEGYTQQALMALREFGDCTFLTKLTSFLLHRTT